MINKAAVKKAIFLCLLAGIFLFIGAGEAHAQLPSACQQNPFKPSCIFKAVFQNTCWVCPAFNGFYQGAVVLGFQISKVLASGMTALLAITLGLWLLFQVAKIFAPFGPLGGITEIFNAIASKIALFIMVLVFVSGGGTGFNNVWNYFIGPIFNTGIGLVNATMEATTNMVTTSGYNNQIIEASMQLDTNCTYAMGLAVTPFNGIASLSSAGASPELIADTTQTGSDLMCMISNMQNNMGMGAVLGISSVMTAGHDQGANTPMINIGLGFEIPDPMAMISSMVKTFVGIIVGIIPLVLFLLAMLLFPLYIIDAIFRLAVVMAITPILAGAYLFPITRNWTSTGIKMVVAASAGLMFQALIAGLGIAMLISTAATFDAMTAQNMDTFRSFKDGVVGIFTLLSSVGVIFWGYTSAGLVVLFLMRKGNQLAQEFVGVAVGDMGGNLASLARNAAIFAGGYGIASMASAAAVSGGGAGATLPAVGGGAPAGIPAPPASPGMAGGAGGGGAPPGGGFAPTGVMSPSNFAGPGFNTPNTGYYQPPGPPATQVTMPNFAPGSTGSTISGGPSSFTQGGVSGPGFTPTGNSSSMLGGNAPSAPQPYRSSDSNDAFEAMKEHGLPSSNATPPSGGMTTGPAPVSADVVGSSSAPKIASVSGPGIGSPSGGLYSPSAPATAPVSSTITGPGLSGATPAASSAPASPVSGGGGGGAAPTRHLGHTLAGIDSRVDSATGGYGSSVAGPSGETEQEAQARRLREQKANEEFARQLADTATGGNNTSTVTGPAPSAPVAPTITGPNIGNNGGGTGGDKK